jgi:predicted nucleic acid-binding Zn ribbon protein
MTDIYDQATMREEQERERSINAVRRQNQTLVPTGACHWCGEDVDGERRFCDADCRDMWQRQESARKRAGA